MKNAIKLLSVLVALIAAVPAFAWIGTADLGTYDPLDELAPYNQTGVRTLSPDTLYTIYGLYYVESGATINIPAGTVIQGVPGATLVVKPGGQIFATGEVNRPIVMTSSELPGNRFPGDWGGVVILGRAPVNQVNPLIEGGIIEGSYGGNDAQDNSGVFKYVRIEYPGYRFQLNNEINGLTLGGVGRGTEIHHVQVSYSFDDSYECFGGTVDMHHLVALGGTDDDFDTDFGYQGRLQFLFSLRDPNNWDTAGQSNGFESDNDGSGSSAQPYTFPVYSNVTLVGPEAVQLPLPAGNTFENAGVLRRNCRTSVFNSVIAGFPRGMSIRDGSRAAAGTDTLRFENNEVTGSYLYSTNNIHDTGRWPMVGTWFMGHANMDSVPRLASVVGLGDLSDLTNPNPVPQAGSVLIGTADWSDSYLADPYFTQVSYRGAFDPALSMDQQWTAGWTNFDCQATDYAALTPVTGEVPAQLASAVNFPNPFNPSTTIRFTVPARGQVSLKIYDVRGREVTTLQDGVLEANTYSIQFNGEGLSSGTYFYRVKGQGFDLTRKMQLVK
ncbi:MAG TPA: T9SS type A sorting domain-containing protein [Candidatus Krumholzibacteria bacterium]|nr:T9SS type A sorting domain-containing protein [Candidatus Krumholzibacteria bacterium]